MRRLLGVSIVLLSSSGCAITDRLDMTNQRLSTVNAQLGETNQRLGDTQFKLGEANRRLDLALGKLDETNRKLNTVEQAILQAPMLRPEPTPAAPVPGISSPRPR